jgi:transcriptional regulator with XRE-family HTH domain
MRVLKRIDNKKTALLLREALRKSGASQSSLSKVVGINQSQVSRLLNGRFQRPTNGIHALCIHLKVIPVARKDAVKLQNYPELALCLDEVLDGSRKKERAVIRLLKSAQTLA